MALRNGRLGTFPRRRPRGARRFAAAFPPRAAAVTRSAKDEHVRRQPRPAGPREEPEKRWCETPRRRREGRRAPPFFIPRSSLRGTKAGAKGRLRPPQPRRSRGLPGGEGTLFLRLMAKRPSDRRSPGRNPGPQGAFEVSMINVSCNSH